MNKKSIYITPLTKILVMTGEDLCGVKLSEAKGKTEYDDISTIGGNDDDDVLPTANSVWFDEEEDYLY